MYYLSYFTTLKLKMNISLYVFVTQRVQFFQTKQVASLYQDVYNERTAIEEGCLGYCSFWSDVICSEQSSGLSHEHQKESAAS